MANNFSEYFDDIRSDIVDTMKRENEVEAESENSEVVNCKY